MAIIKNLLCDIGTLCLSPTLQGEESKELGGGRGEQGEGGAEGEGEPGEAEGSRWVQGTSERAAWATTS